MQNSKFSKGAYPCCWLHTFHLRKSWNEALFGKRCFTGANGCLKDFPGRQVEQLFGHWFNDSYSLIWRKIEMINVSQRLKFIKVSGLIIQVCGVNPQVFLVYCLMRSALDPYWLEVTTLQRILAMLGTKHWRTFAAFTNAVEIAIITNYLQRMCPLRAMMWMISERIIWRLVSACGARCPSSPLSMSAGQLEC